MHQALERVVDSALGRDPLSLYQHGQVEIDRVESEQAAVEAEIQEVERQLAAFDSGAPATNFSRAHAGARLSVLEGRRSELYRQRRAIEGGRPQLAEQAFLDSSGARRLRGELERAAETLALLLTREATLRKEFAARNSVPLGDRRAITVPGIDPVPLLVWFSKREGAANA